MIPTALLILIATAALALWQMPDGLRLLAAQLLARSEALEAQRTTKQAALEQWQQRLGVARENS